MRLSRKLALLTLALFLSPSTAWTDDRFDISYLWHQELAAVQAYRARVVGVLGPASAPRLKVVTRKNLFGLVYVRAGDIASTKRVARVHTQLLVARDLEPAAPTPARTWKIVTLSGSAPEIRKSVAKPTERSETSRETAKVAVLKRARVHPPPVQPAGKPEKSTGLVRPADIERHIERHIKRLRSKGRIKRNERTAWSVYDFNTGKKLVTINEERPLQAASLVKPFVAAAYLSKVAGGSLTYRSGARGRMERMIQRSDNGATNWAIRKLGGPRRVEQLLKQRFPGVFRQTRIVEYIPKGGRTYRNSASARDYSRFLYALWTERFDHSDELKRLMALPGPDRIKTQARKIPRSAKIYNKTGSTARLCADMGIVLLKDQKGREYPYTFIGIIEKQQRAKNYTTWLRSRSRIIGEVSDIVFTHVSKYHGLTKG